MGHTTRYRMQGYIVMPVGSAASDFQGLNLDCPGNAAERYEALPSGI